MTQFDRLSIKQKLLIPGALVIAGFLSVALTFKYQINVRDKAGSEALTVSRFNSTLKETLEQYRLNEIYEKKFLLHGGSRYAELITSGDKEIDALITQLEKSAPTSELRTQLTGLETALGEYSASMEQLVRTKRIIGFDDSLGLHGDMRKSIHEVEAILREIDDLGLVNAMLRLRRYEKDFISRSDDASVAAMEREAKRFNILLEQSSMPVAKKAEVQKAFDQYYADFNGLVEGVRAMEKAVIDGEKATSKVESEIKAFVDATEALRAEKYRKLEATVDRIGTFFYSVLFIIGAVVVGILLLLSRAIARSLDQLIARMRDLADGSGDLSLRLQVSGTDETATLAGLVNSMMDNLSRLIGKVLESGNQIASSVAQIAASTREQEASVTEHAATTSEIASSVKEISSTSKQLGQTAEAVNTLAQGTAASAGDARILLTTLDATMGRMAVASASIADKLAVLNEKASNIGDMVKTINRVADQTNLLSLNAAIEAEKAGEYGRGFAVVATEIRRLADQTAVATYDIEKMVGEVQAAISTGVMGMDKFSEEIHSSVEEAKKAGEQMEKTIEQVQSLAPHMESVNEGLQAQVEGAEMIDEAMANLSEAAQQTAEFVRQSNSAIAELNHVARNLQEGAMIFRVAD